jgi:hypothetical protein
MNRYQATAFAAALLLFLGVVAHPGSTAVAQMANWCPGGSTLLCGTDKTSSCVEIDQRTGQCSRWREQTLYYYYGPDGGGGGNPGDGCSGGGICFY